MQDHITCGAQYRQLAETLFPAGALSGSHHLLLTGVLPEAILCGIAAIDDHDHARSGHGMRCEPASAIVHEED